METVETRWGVSALRKYRLGGLPPAYLWVAVLNDSRTSPYVAPQGIAKSPEVLVRVNHGVWQACCPFCYSAQHASRDEWFYCGNCLNSPAGHRLLPQLWPSNPEKIVKQLAARGHARFQHWEPGETMADLRAQDKDARARGLHLEVEIE